jgi:phosphomannomutase
MALDNTQNIFRAYDIRGIYGRDITEETAELIGRAFGTFIGSGKSIAVSRDFRNSGDSLKKGFISGLTSVGCNVMDIGITTTPMMYFAVRKYRLDGGVSVTASHNPAEWNGFKMTKEGGILCSEGFGMEEIKNIFLERKFNEDEVGKVEKKEITHDYEEFILSKIKNKRKLNIVLDPGNGAACFIAENLFKKAGHNVVVINGKPDGSFPSRPSDPTEDNVDKLKEAVLRERADLGIAFDGDVDRAAFVDNTGKYVPSGNITIPILSEYYLNKNKTGKIVFDICCSSFVEEFIRKHNGIPIHSKVGHSFIMNTLITEGAVFGGEYSNHLYFSEIFGFDDALFAGLKISEIVASGNKKFSEIIAEIPHYPTSGVEEIPCDDDEKFKVVQRVGEILRKEGYRIIGIDGIKAFDKNDDWMLIRGSNTLPVIKINSEAKKEYRMRELFEHAKKIVKSEVPT